MSSEQIVEKESIGKKIYNHLMYGITNMLPFVIGGGLLIAIAFLVDDYSIDPANFGANTPLAAFFKQIGDMAFGSILPILGAFIAKSISGNPAFVVGFVGGMLANEGGSGFLGALLAGFVAGYIMQVVFKALKVIPSALEGLKEMLLYPLLGILIMGMIMVWVVNPPVGAFNVGLNNWLGSMGESSQLLLGITVAMMMAIDMGGPINKATYMFGLVCLNEGNLTIMAAIMAGGMIPPLSIAIATTFFKSKFTKKDREAGLTNYLLGLSFISEGSIPFAAADPLRVIPSATLGAALTGALIVYFECGLRAPHGGVFVLPVIENPIGFLIALAGGALAGGIMMGLLKKKVEVEQ